MQEARLRIASRRCPSVAKCKILLNCLRITASQLVTLAAAVQSEDWVPLAPQDAVSTWAAECSAVYQLLPLCR
jgi:hypothetical protein